MARKLSSNSKRILRLIESMDTEVTSNDLRQRAIMSKAKLSATLVNLSNSGYLDRVGERKVGDKRGRPSVVYRRSAKTISE